MKLRIILSDDNIQVVALDISEAVADFIQQIRMKCEIGDGELIVQHFDKGFDSFVNLAATQTIENLMTLKVRVKQDTHHPSS